MRLLSSAPALLLAATPVTALLLQRTGEAPLANLTTIHVAYSSDASGFTGVLASMLSLSRRLKEPETCKIHLLVSPGDLELAHDLAECFRSELSGSLPAVPEVVLHGLEPNRFGYANIIYRLNVCKDQAIARIHLPKLLPDVDRVLYLDFDTIVKEDIGPLYRMPMQHPIAAVLQPGETPVHMYKKKFASLLSYFENPEAHTFNSGVMLMDLQRWRAENITEALQALMVKTQVHEDQFLLNLLFQPTVRPYDQLDGAWNIYNMGCGALWKTKTLNKGKILHWSCMWKPWTKKYGSHPNYKSYWEAPKRCAAAEKFLNVSW